MTIRLWSWGGFFSLSLETVNLWIQAAWSEASQYRFWDRLTQFSQEEEFQPRLSYLVSRLPNRLLNTILFCLCLSRRSSKFETSLKVNTCHVHFNAGSCFEASDTACQVPLWATILLQWNAKIFIEESGSTLYAFAWYCVGTSNYCFSTQSSLNLKTWKTKWMQIWMLSLPW